MIALHGRSVQYFLTQQRWKQKCVLLFHRRREKRNDQVRVGVRRHQPGYQLRGRGITPEFPWIRNHRVGQAMLIVERNYGQPHPVPHVAGQRFEVGDYEINLPVRDEMLEPLSAPRRLRHGQQVPADRALVAHTIIYVGEAETEDLGDFELIFEVLQSAVERSDVQGVSLFPQMAENFLRARGVAGAFAVDTIKNVGHVRGSIRQGLL